MAWIRNAGPLSQTTLRVVWEVLSCGLTAWQLALADEIHRRPPGSALTATSGSATPTGDFTLFARPLMGACSPSVVHSLVRRDAISVALAVPRRL